MVFGVDAKGGISPEQAILDSVSKHSTDNFDRIFAATQIFEYGYYLKQKQKKVDPYDQGKLLLIDSKIYSLVLKVFDQISDGFNTEIVMYEDEYKLIEKMFYCLIKYYESMEEYQICSSLVNLRDSFFEKTKISPAVG